MRCTTAMRECRGSTATLYGWMGMSKPAPRIPNQVQRESPDQAPAQTTVKSFPETAEGLPGGGTLSQELAARISMRDILVGTS